MRKIIAKIVLFLSFGIWMVGLLGVELITNYFNISIGAYLFLITGLFIFIFGLLAIIFKDKSVPHYIDLYSYGACLIGFFVTFFGIISLNNEKYFSIFFMIAFSLFWLVILIIVILDIKHLKKICSISIDAEVINIKIFIDNNYRKLYIPVFKINYNNIESIICDEKGNLFNSFRIGNTYKLHINPNNINEYYIDSNKNYIYLMIISIIGIISGLMYVLPKIMS